jgi:hypothetical protein
MSRTLGFWAASISAGHDQAGSALGEAKDTGAQAALCRPAATRATAVQGLSNSFSASCRQIDRSP